MRDLGTNPPPILEDNCIDRCLYIHRKWKYQLAHLHIYNWPANEFYIPTYLFFTQHQAFHICASNLTASDPCLLPALQCDNVSAFPIQAACRVLQFIVTGVAVMNILGTSLYPISSAFKAMKATTLTKIAVPWELIPKVKLLSDRIHTF